MSITSLSRSAAPRLGATLLIGAAAAASLSCTAIADVSDLQCKTDADCAKLNSVSAFELPTCNDGVL